MSKPICDTCQMRIDVGDDMDHGHLDWCPGGTLIADETGIDVLDTSVVAVGGNDGDGDRIMVEVDGIPLPPAEAAAVVDALLGPAEAPPTDAIDPERMARAELSEKMVPSPDDVMGDLSMLAGLFYLNQMAWAGYTLLTAELQGSADAGDPVPDEVTKALQAVAEVVGMLDEACIGLGLLPVDARMAK